MFQTLRFRLLASYVVLLLATLLTIVLVGFLTTSVQPAPPGQTLQQLSFMVRSIDIREMVTEAVTQPPRNRLDAITGYLDSFSETHDVRVIWLNIDEDEVTTRFDSAETFTEMEVPEADFEIRRGSPDPASQVPMLPNMLQIYGTFYTDGQEWLFSGFSGLPLARERRGPGGPGNVDDATNAIMLATTRPTQSLQAVLADFGDDLILPILQAGAIGLVVAAVLAYVISRTIAHPLQALSQAATNIARGDLDQRAPVSGPLEVRTLARAFNNMSAEVRATQNAQRDFMASVSHDLKTPLTSIQGYSQAITDGTAREPDKAASIIYDEASRLTRLVNMLTDLARMEAGQLSLNLVYLNISTVVRAVVQRLEVMAEREGITLHLDAPDLPEVAGDGDRLVQVFNNLISNAIKYTEKGGQVWVQAERAEDGVTVSVVDNGIGIPKDDLPRIFDRFYQVDKSRGPKRGTGLGLAITNEIVQMHKGRIEVQSVEGKGTRFTVWLPYAHRAETIVRERSPFKG